MKAIHVREGVEGHPLAWADAAEPAAGPGEVLIRVHAAALNRADLHQRAGNYPPPPGSSQILGLELAGTIESVGAEVTEWAIGDRVCALVTGGAYAELAVAPVETLIRIPDGMGFEAAAALPEAFFTAYTNLFFEGDLKHGETVVVHAGASGVGTAAIQLAHRSGATVYTTVGTAEKAALCQTLGADAVVNYREHDFAKILPGLPGYRGLDLVFDMVGKDYLERNLELLNYGGRVVFVSLLSGDQVCTNLRILMGKRLRLIGTTLRIRSLEEKGQIRDELTRHFGGDLASGTVRPVVDRTFAIQDVEEAHEYMAANKNLGKLVLNVT